MGGGTGLYGNKGRENGFVLSIAIGVFVCIGVKNWPDGVCCGHWFGYTQDLHALLGVLDSWLGA
jgi:hypothetical protein